MSSDVVYNDVTSMGNLKQVDAVLVACFSVHPLVKRLAGLEGEHGKLAVTGIFEAGILASLALVTPGHKWGIVTTGKYWEAHLTDGVNAYLGTGHGASNDKFAGVQTTGLDAGDFHGGVDPAVIREKLEQATRRLLKKGQVDCVVMGCAGMAGLEAIIRSVAVDEYGPEIGSQVCIIDGVKAGIGLLEQTLHNRRMFQKK